MAHPLDWLTSFGIMVRYIRIVLLAGLLRIRFCALICFVRNRCGVWNLFHFGGGSDKGRFDGKVQTEVVRFAFSV